MVNFQFYVLPFLYNEIIVDFIRVNSNAFTSVHPGAYTAHPVKNLFPESMCFYCALSGQLSYGPHDVLLVTHVTPWVHTVPFLGSKIFPMAISTPWGSKSVFPVMQDTPRVHTVLCLEPMVFPGAHTEQSSEASRKCKTTLLPFSFPQRTRVTVSGLGWIRTQDLLILIRPRYHCTAEPSQIL